MVQLYKHTLEAFTSNIARMRYFLSITIQSYDFLAPFNPFQGPVDFQLGDVAGFVELGKNLYFCLWIKVLTYSVKPRCMVPKQYSQP